MVDNVITVSIGNSRKITTRPAWLTDKGMILRFVGVDLPNYYVVDFSRSLSEQALPVIGTPEGVAIPSELFHNSDKIFAWLRLTQGDNVHFTVYQITIPLQQRSEISNVQPTPEQEDIIDQAIEALNEANVDAKLGGGGINSTDYVQLYNFTATTATDGTHSHPHANTGIEGRIDKRYSYRVTFDGDEYILPAQLACMEYESGLNSYTFEYVGNISLYRASMNGTLNQPFDVPFLIASDDEENDGTYSIHVYTNIAGEHTVKIEKIVLDLDNIPPALIYKSMHVPFEYSDNSSTYNVFSVGCNKFIGSTTKSGYAFGYDNKISGNSGMAFGQRNEVSGGHASIAIGYKNTASGEYSHANGWRTVASGNASYSEGFSTVASGGGSHAEGTNTKSGGDCSHAEGDACRTLARGSHAQGGGTYLDTTQAFCHVGGVNNETSMETGKTVSITRYNPDGTVAATANRTLGKYAEVIGNGDSDDARSNARTLDWDGNEGLAGGLTLGMGTEDEIHITPVQLKALLNLI